MGEKIKVIEINLNVPGYHNVYNACGAASVCRHLNVNPLDIKEGIESSVIESGRMEIIEKNGKTIINDCYNANPISVRSAIDTLHIISQKNKGRSVAILGDMLELGESSIKLHQEIGMYLSEKNIDVLIACGKLSFHLCEGYSEASSSDSDRNDRNDSVNSKGLSFYFKNKEELGKKLSQIIKPGDCILLKGSRANRMESIVNLI